MSRHLGVVHHSRRGSTAVLCQAAVTAAGAVIGTTSEPVELRSWGAFEAGPDEVLWADALLMATPAHFGYMSGALKDFFERVFYPCAGTTAGLSYGLIVKGDTDVAGAVASVATITTGLRWNLVLPPVTVVGAVTAADTDRAAELGATLAAGLGESLF